MGVQVPRPNSGVSLQRVGQEAILHDQRNGRAHVINEPAARVWELCDGQADINRITDAFAASYSLPASDVRDDVVYILSKFHDLCLID